VGDFDNAAGFWYLYNLAHRGVDFPNAKKCTRVGWFVDFDAVLVCVMITILSSSASHARVHLSLASYK